MVKGETQQTGNDRKQLRPYSTTSGMLFASAAAPFAVLQGAFGSLSGAPALLMAGAVGAAALILLASLTITRRPLFGRIVVTLVIAGVLALALPLLVEAPVVALAALIASTAALAMLWRAGIPLMALAQGGRPAKEGRTQGAAIVALTVWILWSFSGVHRSVADALLVGWAMFSSSLLSLDWAIHNLKHHRARAVVVLAAAGVALATAIGPALRGNWWWMMSTLAGVAACSTVLLRRTPQSALQEVSWWEPLLGHPERLFVGTFAAMCAGGAALLALPYSAASGQSIAEPPGLSLEVPDCSRRDSKAGTLAAAAAAATPPLALEP